MTTLTQRFDTLLGKVEALSVAVEENRAMLQAHEAKFETMERTIASIQGYTWGYKAINGDMRL